jgi:hypothetical protein
MSEMETVKIMNKSTVAFVSMSIPSRIKHILITTEMHSLAVKGGGEYFDGPVGVSRPLLHAALLLPRPVRQLTSLCEPT